MKYFFIIFLSAFASCKSKHDEITNRQSLVMSRLQDDQNRLKAVNDSFDHNQIDSATFAMRLDDIKRTELILKDEYDSLAGELQK